MHQLNAGYQPGNHWVNCMRCGFDYRASKVKKEWTGLIVCEECWEPRHPQDFVRGVSDDITPPSPVNPRPADKFTDVTFAADTPAHDIPGATFGSDID
jgi:hypothetical protein